MSYRLKLDLTATQAATLFTVTRFLVADLVERGEDFVDVAARLREMLQPYAFVDVEPGHEAGVTVKLDLTAREEAALHVILAASLDDMLQRHNTIGHPMVADIVAVLREMASYAEAREAAREITRS